MRIAVDAMGGDQAPAKILQGAMDALELLEPGDELILVGNEDVIRREVGAGLDAHKNVRIEASTQVITMDDSPVEAIRGKRDSSIVRMVKLAKDGGADAIISAGNTGALVAAGVLMLKPLPGVDRPGIAVVFPSSGGPVMLCDAGANPQAKPQHLHQYAVMASLYMQALHGVAKPRVGVLNVGTEDEKGTPLVKEAKALIAADGSLDLMGYIEGRDVFRHGADVVVTDGFTGNVLLKAVEGWAEMLMQTMAKEVAVEAPGIVATFKPVLGRVAKRFDHEEYGGALLLGVSGLFLKVHGSGGARAIKNAVGKAKAAGRLDINKRIVDRLAAVPAAKL